MKSGETKFLQELVLYAASAAFSCLVLFVGIRQLDPNREASKKALETKKEIARRLGRPLIQTNSYEVLPSLYTYTSYVCIHTMSMYLSFIFFILFVSFF